MRLFSIVSLTALLTLVPALARAQSVDACQIFPGDFAQEIAGKPMKQTRSIPGKVNGLCEFKDSTGLVTVSFELWKMVSPADASKYMRATMTQAADQMRGKPEPLEKLGDEAFYVDRAMSLYARKGNAWIVIGYPNKAAQVDVARKVLAKL